MGNRCVFYRASLPALVLTTISLWCGVLLCSPESESADRLHKRFKSRIAENNPLTQALLVSHPRYPFHMEENMHPSGSVFSTSLDLALLLTWDEYSGSQPCKTDRILARPPREGLDTLSQRKWITIAVCGAYRVNTFLSVLERLRHSFDTDIIVSRWCRCWF